MQLSLTLPFPSLCCLVGESTQAFKPSGSPRWEGRGECYALWSQLVSPLEAPVHCSGGPERLWGRREASSGCWEEKAPRGQRGRGGCSTYSCKAGVWGPCASPGLGCYVAHCPPRHTGEAPDAGAVWACCSAHCGSVGGVAACSHVTELCPTRSGSTGAWSRVTDAGGVPASTAVSPFRPGRGRTVSGSWWFLGICVGSQEGERLLGDEGSTHLT